MSSIKSLLKPARLLHLYLGVFTTPALVFFAFTGFLQTFSFHETTRGRDYKPPKIFVELGQLHKKQTIVVPERKPQAPPSARPAGDKPASDQAVPLAAPRKTAPEASAEPTKKKNLWPMKIFFGLIAFSLLLSTLTGLYMAYNYVRNKVLVTICLVAGIVIPLLLLQF